MFKIGIKVKNIKKHIIETLFQGKKSPTVIIVPYGQFVNAPDDLPVGILSDQGHAESLYAFVMDLENLETLESGEIALGIPSKKARIFFRDTGKITFKIGDVEGGDFAVRFNELESKINDLGTALNSHVHDGVIVSVSGGSGAPAVGVSGSSNSPTSDLSIDISAAKIEELELPELIN